METIAADEQRAWAFLLQAPKLWAKPWQKKRALFQVKLDFRRHLPIQEGNHGKGVTKAGVCLACLLASMERHEQGNVKAKQEAAEEAKQEATAMSSNVQ